MKENELKNCDFIKTVLMIFVVLGHSMIFWRGNWFSIQRPVYTSQLLAVVTNWINSFHIYGFTLVSGYIFNFLKVEKNVYNDFKVYTYKKIKRLLVPYIFVSAVWVIPISCYFFKYDLSTIVKNYVFATSPSQL